MTKTVSIFGSTGSIGQNTIDIITHSPEKYSVLGITAKSNYQLLAMQAISVNAKYVCIYDSEHFVELKELLKDYDIEVLCGAEGMNHVASLGSDIVVAAVVGSAGLEPTYQAIQSGSNIALANKESLVCAGKIFTHAARDNQVHLIPTDSEHNAIFQVFEEKNRNQINKIILTASGGPFLNTPIDQLDKITPEQATKHPNWKMGKKITVDCSNMVNKGLEIIEAHYLFDMPSEKIDVLIHPQSIIHSMVAYNDGSNLAQLGAPDMRTPISYALDWPIRPNKKLVKELNLAEIGKLEFFDCDYKRFAATKLCKDSIDMSGNSQIIINAANEIAVENFLNKKIAYTSIVKIIEKMLTSYSSKECSNIQEVIATDREYRKKTQELIDGSNF